MIVDSAPPNPTPQVFARGFIGALYSLIGKEQYENFILTPLVEFFAKILFALFGTGKQFESQKSSFYNNEVSHFKNSQ